VSPVTLDFSNVEDSQFKQLPSGDYECTIFAINTKKAKGDGSEYLEFVFKLADSEQRLWRNYSLKPQALWALKQLLIRLGFSEDEVGGQFQFNEQELLGTKVICRVKETEYQGRPSNEVIDVFTPEVGGEGGWS